MSILRAVLPGFERRANAAVPFGDSTPPAPSMAAQGSGPISETAALQVAAVYGCVGVLADSVATLPVNLYDSTEATRKRLPATSLITQPYAEISSIDWLVQFTISLALRGNFYGQIIERDRDRYPVQVKPWHPDQVRVTRLPGGQIEYRFGGRPVSIDDVIHIRLNSVPNALVGLNPIEHLRTTLGLARNAEQYGSSFFSNSALPNGVIEVPGQLDEDEVLAMGKTWLGAHQGVGKANLPAILTEDAKFHPISITPNDAQFLESRQFSEMQICGRIFRIPPHMVGIVDRTTSWGNGIEQQERGFITNTLQGYLSRYEDAMTRLHPAGQYVRFDLSHRLRGDTLQRYQGYGLGILGGFLCPDDVRAKEDMPPLPDGLGQTFLAPANTTTLQAQVDATLNQKAGDSLSDVINTGGA